MPDPRNLSFEDAIDMLEWHANFGVDLAVDEEPTNQFEVSARAPSPSPILRAPQQSQPPTGRTQAAPPEIPSTNTPDIAADKEAATALAATANDLDALRAALEDFDGVAQLKMRARQMVFADGNPEAEIMLVGEAPGEEEDRQGKPFVGRSGQLLDLMLKSIGLDRSQVYITNTVNWRPPGNRKPSPQETAACLPFLHRHIELVRPKLIMTLGAPAAGVLMERPVSITKVRGQWQDISINGHPVKLLPTLHPAFLLRQPAQKKLAWRDLLALKHAMRSED